MHHPSDHAGDARENPEGATPVPRISIEAFCELEGTRRLIGACTKDRRLSRAQARVFEGGLPAAIERFHDHAAPHLVIVETGMRGRGLFDQLDELARVCASDARVIVIGAINDPGLGCALVDRGVSAYVALPFTPIELIRTICRLYADPRAPRSRTLAFVGAGGGARASAIARGVARRLAGAFGVSAAVADVPHGPDPHAPCDPSAREAGIDALRRDAALVLLDLPHGQADQAPAALLAADDVVVAATPDLESLRAAKALYDMLRAARPNDAVPKLVLSEAGARSGPEISARKFAEVLGVEPTCVLAVDPAAGGMDGDAKLNDALDHLAAVVTGRAVPRRRSLVRRMLKRA